MQVHVLFFAQLRDVAGTASLKAELESGVTVADLITSLSSNVELFNALQDASLMVSVNHQISDRSCVLNEADEVGFLPPVSGG